MNGSYHILYWRDIPSVVKGKQGRKRLSKSLSSRFMEAIDAAAMKNGDTNSDEYLEGWEASDSLPIEGDANDLFEKVVADLEEQYPRERLVALIKSGGWDK